MDLTGFYTYDILKSGERDLYPLDELIDMNNVTKIAEGAEMEIIPHDPYLPAEIHVVKKSCGQDVGGRWYCDTHKKGFENQMQKDSHIYKGDHVLVWMCFEHGYEVP